MLSHFSRVRLFATLWTVAYQAPLSIGFSRQDYWSKRKARQGREVTDEVFALKVEEDDPRKDM